jgi:twinkle protein
MQEPETKQELISGICSELAKRKISKSTCSFFSYETGRYFDGIGPDNVKGERVHIANYYDDFGNKVVQKLRAQGKRMKVLGDGSKLDLYGKWLWTPNDKLKITITEGELDALSVAEATGCKYPVVSIPSGAKSAKKYLAKNLEWLEKFGAVVLCFDNDEEGRNAAQECAELFSPGKCKIANLKEKDASDMLQAGKAEELKRCLLNAKSYQPDTIVSVEDIRSSALEKPSVGAPWPWTTLSEITYGLQPKSIYTIGAGSGIGKTEFLKEVLLNLTFEQGEKVGAMFLEQSPSQTLLRLVGGMLGKRLHVPGEEWDDVKIQECIDRLAGKVYFYDHLGSQSVDSVISKIRYLVKGLGCKYIILDHLTALAAEMDDERKGIDKTMARLGSLVHELNCTILLVSHLAKPFEGKSYEEGRRVTASAFRGSQSIQYWSYYMIGLERNKLAEDPSDRLVTTVRILKDRFTGESDGVTFYLKYNRDNGRLEELEI